MSLYIKFDLQKRYFGIMSILSLDRKSCVALSILFCFNFLSSTTFCAFAKAIKAEDKTHDVDQSSVFRHLKGFLGTLCDLTCFHAWAFLFLSDLTWISEYLNRIKLYRQRVWMCKVSGKTNLTYEEALLSEEHATEKVHLFPKELMTPALQIIQYSKN